METPIVIAIIVGVVQAIKVSFKVPSRYVPIISLTLGVGIALLYNNATLIDEIISGLIVGLSASGLYSSTKAVIGK